MKIKRFFPLFVIAFLLVGIVSCKTTTISDMSQDDGISSIREDFEDKNWSEVISKVDEYNARYPYSKYNVEANLMQANAYYLSDKYPEAIAAYEDFIRKNPSNSNVNLAYYRIARSYDAQAPEAIDREQVNAKKQ